MTRQPTLFDMPAPVSEPAHNGTPGSRAGAAFIAPRQGSVIACVRDVLRDAGRIIIREQLAELVRDRRDKPTKETTLTDPLRRLIDAGEVIEHHAYAKSSAGVLVTGYAFREQRDAD